MSQQVIIIGGGLSGLSAFHTALERGAKVLLLDKEKFLGGNSTKATSGINAALTNTQRSKDVADSVDAFVADTTKSARHLARPEMIDVLCGDSAPAVHWLQKKFSLDLSLLGRLGGHSFPRTHRGAERFPGMTITYALMEGLEHVCENEPHRATYLSKARATELLKDNSGAVIGVKYEHDGQMKQAFGPVIIATGGYGADFSENSLLAKHRPDVLHLPTTNGPHCTGDGIKLAQAVGAGLADIQQVQVHPTGLVDPSDPQSKVKWLAAEALRGAGGILVDANGRRFCNELGHRDYVTGEMNKNQGPFWLILNGKSAQNIMWHCKHYLGRGLFRHVTSGKALADTIGVSQSTLFDTFKSYNVGANNKNDRHGRLFFSGVPIENSEEFYVGQVTPVVHYTMGGLNVGPDSQVRAESNAPVDGLFAAGEVMGGVHGVNRLGGSSLLDCVVFGRVAGASATTCLTNRIVQGGAGVAAAGGGQQGATIEVDPSSGKLRVDIKWGNGVGAVSSHSAASPVVAAPSNDSTAPAASAAAAAGAAAADEAPKQRTDITMEEVARHNTKDDCWVVVNGEVLDATSFLADHPGGAKAILLYAGKDATEEFNMLHKPDVVQKYAPEIVLGKLAPAKAKL